MKNNNGTVKIVGLALLALLVGSPLFAYHQDPARLVKKMTRKLTLAENQQTELKKILEDLHAEKEKMMQQFDERILSVLNDGQKEKYKKMKAKKEKRMHNRKKERAEK